MNMPEEFKPPTEQKSNINLPLPDLREDIERIKSQKSLEGETAGRTIPAGFPLIDLTKPPPGYNPYYQAGFSQSRLRCISGVKNTARTSARLKYYLMFDIIMVLWEGIYFEMQRLLSRKVNLATGWYCGSSKNDKIFMQ